MRSQLFLASLTAAASTGNTIWATPHESYSSSVGVLGCKINTNRVAYWPQPVTCDNICVSVQYENRQVYLLRIDQSEGAHDMSYDAWNYLYTGNSASDKPVAGGAIAMTFQQVTPDKCSSLIRTSDGKLPLSAANSMNYVASCLDQPKSWVAKNYALFNILDPICTLGHNEQCNLDWPAKNQASCTHTLGLPDSLKDTPVYNIQYPSGKRVLAGSPPGTPGTSGTDNAAAATATMMAWPSMAMIAIVVSWHLVSF